MKSEGEQWNLSKMRSSRLLGLAMLLSVTAVASKPQQTIPRPLRIRSSPALRSLTDISQDDNQTYLRTKSKRMDKLGHYVVRVQQIHLASVRRALLEHCQSDAIQYLPEDTFLTTMTAASADQVSDIGCIAARFDLLTYVCLCISD